VALIVFPIVLGLTAVEVLAFDDRLGTVRTRGLQRRDRRAARVLASVLGGLVLLVCLGAAIQAVLGA